MAQRPHPADTAQGFQSDRAQRETCRRGLLRSRAGRSGAVHRGYDLRVRVLGTAFCVQAYENSGQAEVVLEHGSVRLQTPEGVNLVTLQPDQRALYDAAADNLEISHVNASHLVLSQYDLVTMANATLHEIISHIETTYGVRISVPGRYGDKRYAFNYQRSNSLEEVLNIVEYMTGEHCEVIFRQK